MHYYYRPKSMNNCRGSQDLIKKINDIEHQSIYVIYTYIYFIRNEEFMVNQVLYTKLGKDFSII